MAEEIDQAGPIEELGPRSYRGLIVTFSYIRAGGRVFSPISATRRMDGYLGTPDITGIHVFRWPERHYVCAVRRSSGEYIDDSQEVTRICRLSRIGRLLLTFGLGIFPGLLATPLATALIVGYGVHSYVRKGRILNAFEVWRSGNLGVKA